MPSLRPRLKILVSPLCAEANIFQSGLLTDTHWKEIEAVALWLQGDGARSPKKFWFGLQRVLLCVTALQQPAETEAWILVTEAWELLHEGFSVSEV